MTWEGGWDYSEALLMRAVWGLDHTTPHHIHYTIYIYIYIYTLEAYAIPPTPFLM